MKTLLIIPLTCFLATVPYAAGQAGTAGDVVLTYELYSWQNQRGGWNFCLLFTTNRQKTVEEVFNKKSTLYGLDALKKRISELPIHSNIVWFDRLTLSGTRVKGSESLRYPPKEIVEEVKHYAAGHNVEISGP
jgi:hypothetical protein